MIGHGKGHRVAFPYVVKRFEGGERDYVLKMALELERYEKKNQ